jgi:formate dehydrogenase subunit gamma
LASTLNEPRLDRRQKIEEHSMAKTSGIATIKALVEAKKSTPGALLPILHDIQDALGHVPSDAVPVIAAALNLSRAEVHGVITYYHHFRQHPAGRHVLRLCRAEACQSLGSDALADHAKASLGCDFHETTEDGTFTLEPVYCLGQCACGPAMLIDDSELHARLTPEKLDAIVAAKRGAQ